MEVTSDPRRQVRAAELREREASEAHQAAERERMLKANLLTPRSPFQGLLKPSGCPFEKPV